MSQLDPEAIAQRLKRMLDRIHQLKQFETLTLDKCLQNPLTQAEIETLEED
jgi:hypothetical protein